MTFCFGDGIGEEKFQFNCAFCRSQSIIDETHEMEVGGTSFLKIAMARASIRTHAVPNGCCLPKGSRHCVLFHQPCEEHGCYECFNSQVSVSQDFL